MPSSSPAHILLVEDNPADAHLIEQIVAASGLGAHLHIVEDGESALAKVREGRRPDLILLDLRLPSLHGLEVLRAIKNETPMRTVPVVVLTASATDPDVWWSYQLHASAFIVKPHDLEALEHAVTTALRFYLSVARLPPVVSEEPRRTF